MTELGQNLRLAARGLYREPGFAVTAVLTLALGIGANTAIFSFVDATLLTPPPFREPGRIVMIWGVNPEAAKTLGFEELPLSTAVFYDWQNASRSFSNLGLLQSDHMTLTGEGEAEQLGVVRVAGDFFGALGTAAAVGRTLLPADDAPGNPAAVVLSYNFWRRRFAGDPGIVGRQVTLNGMPMTLVGVMPPRFAFPRGGSEVPAAYGFAVEPDAWVPLALSEQERQNRSNRFSLVVGRLAPGTTAAAAEAEIEALCERLAEDHPDSDRGWSARLVSITDQMAGGLRRALLMLWTAVGLVLLIACANVANLMLARAASREREVALRTAIGAGRRGLVAQLLTESALLSAAGGALGVALAWVTLRACATLLPPGTAGAATFALDGRAFAFTAAVAIVATILAGLVPALQMTRPDLAASLREGTRGGGQDRASHRTRGLLVCCEVALAVLLLIGAGLLVRSFVRLLAVEPGFAAEGILTFRIDLPPTGFSPPERVAFFNRVIEGMHSLPGVEASAVISELALSGSEQFAQVNFEGRPLPQPGEMWSVSVHSITSEYFETMGIGLRRGRLLSAADTAAAPLAAVVDEAMARVYWPGEDPVGKRLRFGRGQQDRPWMTVVGVVESVRHSSLQAPPEPTLYQTTAQIPERLTPYYVWVVTRTAGDPRALAAAARAAVRALDADQPLSQVRTMEQVISHSLATLRFNLLLLGLFAALALVLAVVGIHGLTAYAVARRTRELGLRMALGARPGQVRRLVLRQVGSLAGLGVLAGLGAALALTRVMSSLLYGVGATDPATFAAVAIGLVLTTLAAAYLPGRRATRVDPVVSLRAE
jgi:putative ABC transport system permease protein